MNDYIPQEGELIEVFNYIQGPFLHRIFKNFSFLSTEVDCFFGLSNLDEELSKTTNNLTTWKYWRRLNGEIHNDYKPKTKSKNKTLKLYL